MGKGQAAKAVGGGGGGTRRPRRIRLAVCRASSRMEYGKGTPAEGKRNGCRADGGDSGGLRRGQREGGALRREWVTSRTPCRVALVGAPPGLSVSVRPPTDIRFSLTDLLVTDK